MSLSVNRDNVETKVEGIGKSTDSNSETRSITFRMILEKGTFSNIKATIQVNKDIPNQIINILKDRFDVDAFEFKILGRKISLDEIHIGLVDADFNIIDVRRKKLDIGLPQCTKITLKKKDGTFNDFNLYQPLLSNSNPPKKFSNRKAELCEMENLMRVGNKEVDTMDFESAIGYYSNVIKRYSLHSDIIFDAYNKRARCYRKIGKYNAGASDCSFIIKMIKTYHMIEDHEIYIERGLCYIELRKYEEAIYDFTRAINIVPEKYEYYIYRGDAFFHHNNYGIAIEHFSHARDLNREEIEKLLEKEQQYCNNIKTFTYDEVDNFDNFLLKY